MSKTLWVILAALMFAGTYSISTSSIDNPMDPGEGSYPTPICAPGGTCK
ncbi:MAG TPA: hypothetical protein VN622_18175 [Clostridia bacterium]|nr:hypothetical protein [Clostridia bacterium]